MRGDADQPGVVIGGEAEALAVAAEPFGREAGVLGEVGVGGFFEPAFLLALKEVDRAGLFLDLALERGDLAALLSEGLAGLVEILLQLLAGEAADLLFHHGGEVGHLRRAPVCSAAPRDACLYRGSGGQRQTADHSMAGAARRADRRALPGF